MLSVVALGTNQVFLAWTVPGGATGISGYNLTRNGKPLATVSGTESTYLDGSVSPSSVYVYLVEATGAAGAAPLRSWPVQIKTPAPPETPDTTPPSTPDIQEAVAGDGQVVMAWDAATDDTDISGYVIRRNGKQLAIVNSGTQIYVDTAVQPQTNYEYTVEAVDVVGHHSKSGQPVKVTTGTFTTPAPAPAQPSPPAPAQPSPPAPAQPGGPAVAPSTSLAAAPSGGYTAQLKRYPYLTDVVGSFATINWATDRSATTGSVKWGRRRQRNVHRATPPPPPARA